MIDEADYDRNMTFDSVEAAQAWLRERDAEHPALSANIDLGIFRVTFVILHSPACPAVLEPVSERDGSVLYFRDLKSDDYYASLGIDTGDCFAVPMIETRVGEDARGVALWREPSSKREWKDAARTLAHLLGGRE